LFNFNRELEVAYCRLARLRPTTSSTRTNIGPESRRSLAILVDGRRLIQKDLDIAEYTDAVHNPMIPHTIVLEPAFVVYKVYNGYWFFGRPTVEDLRQDLRAITKEMRPDWDITTPELKSDWQQGRKELFYPLRQDVRPKVSVNRSSFAALILRTRHRYTGSGGRENRSRHVRAAAQRLVDIGAETIEADAFGGGRSNMTLHRLRADGGEENLDAIATQFFDGTLEGMQAARVHPGTLRIRKITSAVCRPERATPRRFFGGSKEHRALDAIENHVGRNVFAGGCCAIRALFAFLGDEAHVSYFLHLPEEKDDGHDEAGTGRRW